MSGIKLVGRWKAGWALDLHTTSSIPLGNGQFETTYTNIGNALNKLKYHRDFNRIPVLAKYAIDFLRTRYVTKYLDVIVPVPPSNVNRDRQPVFEIAAIIGEAFNIPVDFDYVRKIKKTEQLKDIDDPVKRKNLLSGAFEISGTKYEKRKVLLFDDLYRVLQNSTNCHSERSEESHNLFKNKRFFVAPLPQNDRILLFCRTLMISIVQGQRLMKLQDCCTKTVKFRMFMF